MSSRKSSQQTKSNHDHPAGGGAATPGRPGTQDRSDSNHDHPAGGGAATAWIEFPGTNVRIPVPDVPEEQAHVGDAESEAVAAHPDFRSIMAEAERSRAAGESIPAEEVYREVGLAPPAAAAAARDKEARRSGGQITVRLPRSVHHDLMARAAEEGVSVNQLVLAYIARGLGASG